MLHYDLLSQTIRVHKIKFKYKIKLFLRNLYKGKREHKLRIDDVLFIKIP